MASNVVEESPQMAFSEVEISLLEFLEQEKYSDPALLEQKLSSLKTLLGNEQSFETVLLEREQSFETTFLEGEQSFETTLLAGEQSFETTLLAGEQSFETTLIEGEQYSQKGALEVGETSQTAPLEVVESPEIPLHEEGEKSEVALSQVADSIPMAFEARPDNNLEHRQMTPPKLGLRLKKLLDAEAFLDTTICAGACGIQFRAHQVVLSASSPVLQRKITEDPTSDMYFIGINPDVFSHVLHYLYTEEVAAEANIVPLCYAANYLEITGLKDKCRQILVNLNLTFVNVWYIFNCAVALRLSDAQQNCKLVIGQNMKECFKLNKLKHIGLHAMRAILQLPFSNIYEIELLNELIAWCKHKERRLFSFHMNILMKMVRFAAISLSELETLLNSDSLVAEDTRMKEIMMHKQNPELNACPEWCSKLGPRSIGPFPFSRFYSLTDIIARFKTPYPRSAVRYMCLAIRWGNITEDLPVDFQLSVELMDDYFFYREINFHKTMVQEEETFHFKIDARELCEKYESQSVFGKVHVAFDRPVSVRFIDIDTADYLHCIRAKVVGKYERKEEINFFTDNFIKLADWEY